MMATQPEKDCPKEPDPRRMVCFPVGKVIAMKKVVMWAKAMTLDPNNQAARTELIRALYELSDFSLDPEER
jgi:hypothetical protein